MPAELIRSAALPAGERPACRMILPAPAAGWAQVAMGEWELRGEGFGDCHPHDEVNYVVSGRLTVRCDGHSVEAGPGEVVRVPAGHPAYYDAPEHARMIFVYGPNPEGLESRTFDDPADAAGSGPQS